ncbi:DUF3152 domain-containing protein [Virgisporangium aliadipatigenens]|uniref:DUF3152 domain-containing protein n=1 Tax=Virgisporangium aliadipatigenens TaxID=741659 RepID=UPI0019457F3A|nr:DUF3152 domain-containing protein [Virgisporangium aliadipatigenens]
MRVRWRAIVSIAVVLVLTACAGEPPPADANDRIPQKPATAVQPAPSIPPSPSPVPPPTGGSGSFTAGSGRGEVLGAGNKLIRYRIEVETGILWGENPVWTPAEFGTTVDKILGAPQGWTESAQHPVTNADVRLSNASWRFQRVDGTAYEVRLRLATPDTVDRECGKVGLDTAGEHSCRSGQTILINLKRWLNGAKEYPVTIDDYRAAVINHEVGHYLGFDHMNCPGPGKPGPIMMTQTINLQGCVPNVHPFLKDGTFPSGPWVQS